MKQLLWRLFCDLVNICPKCEQGLTHYLPGGWYYDPDCHACARRAASPAVEKP